MGPGFEDEATRLLPTEESLILSVPEFYELESIFHLGSSTGTKGKGEQKNLGDGTFSPLAHIYIQYYSFEISHHLALA